jgi:hypothetical protein
MSTVLGAILIAIVIDVAIILIVRMIGKGRPKMSYNQYLQKYGSVGPYNSSDASKYM